MNRKEALKSADENTADKVVILGVIFDRLDREQALLALCGAIGLGEARKVFIVNAHTLNLASSDRDFRQVLNSADLLLNDGAGVQIASWLVGKPFYDNLVGTDLVPQLFERTLEQKTGIFLLGGKQGVPERAAEKLHTLYPGLLISGTQHGYFSSSELDRVIEAINTSRARILIVALGNPLQEKFIHENAHKLDCDLCIGVGGLIDYWGSGLQRAPAWMRRYRLEWVNILVRQPHKWRRYILGNPLFLGRIIVRHLGRRQ